MVLCNKGAQTCCDLLIPMGQSTALVGLFWPFVCDRSAQLYDRERGSDRFSQAR